MACLDSFWCMQVQAPKQQLPAMQLDALATVADIFRLEGGQQAQQQQQQQQDQHSGRRHQVALWRCFLGMSTSHDEGTSQSIGRQHEQQQGQQYALNCARLHPWPTHASQVQQESS